MERRSWAVFLMECFEVTKRSKGFNEVMHVVKPYHV